MNKAPLVAFVASLLVLGCATTPPPDSEQRLVPKAQVHADIGEPSLQSATVVVVRDRGAFASLSFLHFFVNGQRIASFETGERLTIHLKPGEYIFGVKPTDPLGVHAGFSIDQTLAAGKTYRYRLLVDTNAGARIQRVL